MPLISADASQTFNLPGVTFKTMSAPSLGSQENSVWMVRVEAGTRGQPHVISREETFIALGGSAEFEVDGEMIAVEAGSTLVIPAGSTVALTNYGSVAFEAFSILPVGGLVKVDGKPWFTPPWAE